MNKIKKPALIAHRGNTQDYPENTLPAFASAFELGADGIELDVHLTDQSELIVVHDYLYDKNQDYPKLSEVFEKFSSKGKLVIDVKAFKIEAVDAISSLIKKHQLQQFEVISSIQPMLIYFRQALPQAQLGLIFRREWLSDWMTKDFKSDWIIGLLKLCQANVIHLDHDLYSQRLVRDLKQAGIFTHTHLPETDKKLWERIKRLGIDQCSFDENSSLEFKT